jgi:sporulation protein YlmC with PRC-barrel domain
MADESDGAGAIARSETSDLISSAKVQGTAVYDKDGQRIGRIESFMVGKRDGKVRYAVLSFGGLFGIGERRHPLPWDALTYDIDREGYVLAIPKDRLEAGPSHGESEEPAFDPDYGERISDYYGVSM